MLNVCLFLVPHLHLRTALSLLATHPRQKAQHLHHLREAPHAGTKLRNARSTRDDHLHGRMSRMISREVKCTDMHRLTLKKHV